MNWRDYFDTTHPKFNHTLIVICGLVGLIVVLYIGIQIIIGKVIGYALAFIVAGAILAALDGVLSVFALGRNQGLLIYKTEAHLRFWSALVLAAVYAILKVYQGGNPILELSLVAVMVPGLLIGFLIGSLLFTNRAAIAKTAQDLREGKGVDLAGTARAVAGAAGEAAKGGLNEAVVGASNVRGRLSDKH